MDLIGLMLMVAFSVVILAFPVATRFKKAIPNICGEVVAVEELHGLSDGIARIAVRGKDGVTHQMQQLGTFKTGMTVCGEDRNNP